MREHTEAVNEIKRYYGPSGQPLTSIKMSDKVTVLMFGHLSDADTLEYARDEMEHFVPVTDSEYHAKMAQIRRELAMS